MAAICDKRSCGTLTFSVCPQLYNRGQLPLPGERPGSASSLVEVPYVSWNHIIKSGYWCMPCCILDEYVHPKIPVCSQIPTFEDVCNQNIIHGRCGIDFHP